MADLLQQQDARLQETILDDNINTDYGI